MPTRFRIPRLAALPRLLRAHPRLRRTLIGIAGVCVLFFGFVVWLLFPYLRTLGDIGAGPESSPSRLYGEAAEIRVGGEGGPPVPPADPQALSYRSFEDEALPAGRYREGDDALAVHLRRHMTPRGWVAGDLLLVQFKKGKI